MQALRIAALLALVPLTGTASRIPSEIELDDAANQRYSTVSRLSWHTDFKAAQEAARTRHKPILHLRMLGRLDEDLSCTNSRLFRATLYANKEVSQFLRDNFVLYWSTERPVPKITIDFGDGRKLERTVTGNSAHYVLDADGRVLDVLPGLYAPVAFKRELEGSLELAAKVRTMNDTDRAKAIVAYHSEEAQQATKSRGDLVGVPFIVGRRGLITQNDISMAAARAQRATMSKAVIEVPDLRYITASMPKDAYSSDNVEMWAAAGQALYGIGNLGSRKVAVVLENTENSLPIGAWAGINGLVQAPQKKEAAKPEFAHVLDKQSMDLVKRIDAGQLPENLRGDSASRDDMIARLEQHIVADTAINQLQLRPQISAEIVRLGGNLDFNALNGWIYASVFNTPASDPWLGMLPRTDFTGLPGDGAVLRGERVAQP